MRRQEASKREGGKGSEDKLIPILVLLGQPGRVLSRATANQSLAR